MGAQQVLPHLDSGDLRNFSAKFLAEEASRSKPVLLFNNFSYTLQQTISSHLLLAWYYGSRNNEDRDDDKTMMITQPFNSSNRVTTTGVRRHDIRIMMFYVCADTMLMTFAMSFRCHLSRSLDGKAMALMLLMLSLFYDDWNSFINDESLTLPNIRCSSVMTWCRTVIISTSAPAD
mgnify:CR=1 FL=1